MNRRVAITAGAALDLEDIWTYIAADNPEAATELLIALNEQFESLCDHPMLGRPRNKILLNLRSLVFRNYVIFYLPSDDEIEIWHVLHSSRDIERFIERFFDSLPR